MKTFYSILILVIFTASASYSQIFNMQNGTFSTCSGTFYDSGGSGGQYGNNESYTMTFCPGTSGLKMRISFTSWSLGSGDNLAVYDADNSSGSPVSTFNNSISANGQIIEATLTNTSGCITFVFTSDASSTGPGWAANISCFYPCQLVFAKLDNVTPDTTFDGYVDICPGDTVFLIGKGYFPENGNAYNQSDATSSFEWDFGDTTQGSGQSVYHVYDHPGGYEINLVVTDSNGCISNNNLELRVRVSTHPNFFGTTFSNSIICSNQTATLTGVVNPKTWYGVQTTLAGTTFLPDGSGVSYTTAINYSIFNPGQTLTTPNDIIAICATMEHSYLGDLEIKISCPTGNSVSLKSWSSFSITGNGGATFLGEPVSVGCPDLNSAITMPGTGYEYCWTLSPTYGTMNVEGSSSPPLYNYTDLNGNVHTAQEYLPAGSYTPDQPLSGLVGCALNGNWTITVTDHQGLDNGYIFSWSLYLNPALYNNVWQFTPQFNSANQQWNNDPDIINTAGQTITVAPTTPGVHNYTYTATDNFGCTYDTTLSIMVVSTPTVDLGPDTSLCAGAIYTLDAGPPGTNYINYNWSTGATSQIIQAGSFIGTQPFYVMVTNTDGTSLTCTGSDTMNLTIFPQPNINLGPDTCTETGITLDAGTPGTPGTNFIYNWSTGATSQTITATVTDEYYVDVQSGPGSPCHDKDTINIKVIPTPSFNLGPDTTICIQRSVFLDATQQNDSPEFTYLWTPGGATTSTITYSPSGMTGPQIVTVVKTGCTSKTDSVIVTGKLCEITVPNVITPNGDAFNEKFVIVGLADYPKTMLQIFNRWGKKVYESSDYQNDWDGENNHDGVYYYVLTFVDYTDPMTGTITVIGKK